MGAALVLMVFENQPKKTSFYNIASEASSVCFLKVQ